MFWEWMNESMPLYITASTFIFPGPGAKQTSRDNDTSRFFERRRANPFLKGVYGAKEY
jgi:hypothetical protein